MTQHERGLDGNEIATATPIANGCGPNTADLAGGTNLTVDKRACTAESKEVILLATELPK